MTISERLNRVPGVIRHGLRLLLIGAACLLLLAGLGALLQLGSTGELPPELQDPDTQQYYETLRQPVIDLDNAPDFWVDVDYDEGEGAPWWPKQQSPFFDELVTAGKLPPLIERIGPEPVVYQGFKGIGQYGGDWWHLASDIDAVRLFMQYFANNNTLVRYAPYGDPIRPHLAKRVEHNDDYTVWTVHLRRGVRWSDGHPFTAADIMFWWEHVANDPQTGWIPETMRVAGQPGRIEKEDDFTLLYIFPEENPGFLNRQASAAGSLYMAGPAHYLRQFHHRLGDQELVRAISRETNQSSENVLRDRNHIMNPERPSLSPWLLRTYRSNGPWTLVRNPYYFAVDPEGNQLPYMDRVVFRQIHQQLHPKTIVEGSVSAILASGTDYASLMSQREVGGYSVRHWYVGGGGMSILPNRQLPVSDKDPTSAARRDLLRNPAFRRALSVAINRQPIIDAEFEGVGIPSNPGPGPGQVGYDLEHLRTHAEFDPEQANTILDRLGLTRRDNEGFRTLPDGRRLSFRLVGSDAGAALSVREDWKRVGIRLVVQQKPHRLMLMEMLRADFLVAGQGTGGADNWGALGAGAPYWNWYYRGGLHGDEEALRLPIQPGPLEKTLMRMGNRASVTPDPEEKEELIKEIMRYAREQVWSIGIVSQATVGNQAQFVVKDGLRGVPDMIFSSFTHGTPNNAAPETWHWEDPGTVNGRPASQSYLDDRAASIRDEIQHITLPPRQVGPTTGQATTTPTKINLGWLVQFAIWTIIALFILLSALRHPFVIRRLALMVPTLFVISIIIYAGIQLPPGSYLDTRIMSLEEQGLTEVAIREAEELREKFHLDDGGVKNYFRWSGLLWFTSFAPADRGLLQGHMGFSMVDGNRVNDLMGDRLLLTFVISLGTILFTWAVAIPIGVYSAVRQYSKIDYALTILGFLGMCIPGFILALVMMLLSRQLFGVTITGLFSDQFAMQDYWNWAKFVDLLKHLWVPVVVIGTAGTAGMIRVMRANLLDELKKPYVVTARAKGVRPVNLLFKYPFRLALLPFVSGIGGILPSLISGGAIVAIILSLPTIGPMLLDSVMHEDVYMAGSLLFLLSSLTVIGVLISDLLLMVLDPRIRMGGESR